jgi:hypothetical protein
MVEALELMVNRISHDLAFIKFEGAAGAGAVTLSTADRIPPARRDVNGREGVGY